MAGHSEFAAANEEPYKNCLVIPSPLKRSRNPCCAENDSDFDGCIAAFDYHLSA